MKKGKKVLSVILALVMVFSSLSAAVIAFAADDDPYTEIMTEERVNELIDIVDDLIQQKVITGDVFEEIYKFLPSLSALAMIDGNSSKASNRVAYYQELYPERFEKLSTEDGKIKADVLDEEGNIVEKGTFTLFFEENPITFANEEEILKEAEKLVDMILVDNVVLTLGIIPLIVPEAAPLLGGVDKICKAAGIEQADELFFIVQTQQGEKVRTYVKNIIRALLPDAASGIITLLRNVADKEDLALLYAGASDVLNNLSAVLTMVNSMFPLPENVMATVTGIVDGFNALPTLDDPKRFDLEKAAVMAFDAYANVDFDLVFVDDIKKAADGKNFYLGRLEPVLEALGSSETNAEAVVILYSYIYDNVLQVPGNMAIIFKLANLPNIDPGMFASMSKDDVFVLIYSLATGKDISPEEPEEPTDPPTSENPPATDAPADDPVTPPANGDSAVVGIFAAMAVLSGAALVIAGKKK